ncbi:MAG: protein-methionine-sulfoxide reductase heme-binding subunit MsrQ [Thioalkalispiraceae bacterium]|jgi:sulfoxide reductase heme-binding subunit YedZ
MSKKQLLLLKLTVFSLCLLPLAWLIFALINDQLGANPIEFLTRHLGEWGLQLLLVTLCMTPLKDLLQQPWPIQLRRMLGLFSFFYLVLHLFSYLWLDQFFDWSEIWIDIVKRPFITVGVLSLLGLLPLALTSNRWSQRKMGKRWRQLHLLVYPTAILAVLHFFWLVKLDLLRPTLFAIALALLLAYRWLKWVYPRSRS